MSKKKNGITIANTLKIIGGGVVGLGAIFVGVFWFVDFVRIPDKVEANEKRIYSVEEYIDKQQTYTEALNDLMRQQQEYQQKQQTYYPQYQAYPNQPYQQQYQQPYQPPYQEPYYQQPYYEEQDYDRYYEYRDYEVSM